MRPSRRWLTFAAAPCLLGLSAVSGCGSPEVGAVKAGEDGAKAQVSAKEGRFKETLPSAKPTRTKKAGADEGIESR